MFKFCRESSLERDYGQMKSCIPLYKKNPLSLGRKSNSFQSLWIEARGTFIPAVVKNFLAFSDYFSARLTFFKTCKI